MCDSCDNHKCTKKSNCSDDQCGCDNKFAVTVITEKVVGPRGPKGDDGCVGPTGPCGPGYECKCYDYLVDFSKHCVKYNSSVIYKVCDKFILMVYSFAINDCKSCETRLAVRTDSRHSCDNGIGLGCRDSCNESKHFIQMDLGDYIRIKNLKCADPKMRIGGRCEKFCIHGSNKLGELGQQLYSYKSRERDRSSINDWFVIPSFNTTDLSECGDLKHYGVIPFRYISVISCGTEVVLNSLCFSLC
jgi:hypothetical protein